MNQADCWLSFFDRISKCIKHKRLRHVVHQRPSDNSSGSQIHQQREIAKDSTFKRNVRDVANPDLIDPSWCLCFHQKVRRVTQSVPAVRGFRHERLRLNGSQTECFHYPRDLSRTTRVPIVMQLAGDPSSSVTSAMSLKDDPYQRSEFRICFFKDRGLRTSPGIERGAIHGHEFTDFCNRCDAFLADRFNSRIHICYSLRPKMANAFFKTSRSRSTRRSSVSSSRTRPSSELATGPL